MTEHVDDEALESALAAVAASCDEGVARYTLPDGVVVLVMHPGALATRISAMLDRPPAPAPPPMLRARTRRL